MTWRNMRTHPSPTSADEPSLTPNLRKRFAVAPESILPPTPSRASYNGGIAAATAASNKQHAYQQQQATTQSKEAV